MCYEMDEVCGLPETGKDSLESVNLASWCSRSPRSCDDDAVQCKEKSSVIPSSSYATMECAGGPVNPRLSCMYYGHEHVARKTQDNKDSVPEWIGAYLLQGLSLYE